jgi:hypothetical protein
MTDKPILFSGPMVRAILDGRKTQTRRVVSDTKATMATKTAPGDRLWVREALERGVTFGIGGDEIKSVVYRADGKTHTDANWRWKRDTLPSIHCPRALSRITLEVTGVKVERLQDISEDDAIAEGMTQETAEAVMQPEELAVYASTHILCPHSRARILFEHVWETINGPGSWDANPWVAAYTFRVIPNPTQDGRTS